MLLRSMPSLPSAKAATDVRQTVTGDVSSRHHADAGLMVDGGSKHLAFAWVVAFFMLHPRGMDISGIEVVVPHTLNTPSQAGKPSRG